MTPPTLSEIAGSLKRDTEWLTARAVEAWVQQNIKWVFYYHPRDLDVTWRTKEGDCTDMAMLMKEMLELNGITSHIVHGYGTWAIPNKGEQKVKHDWLMAAIHAIDNTVRDIQYDGVRECLKYELVGDGFW